MIVFPRRKILTKFQFFVGDGLAVFDPQYTQDNPVPASIDFEENCGIFVADKKIWLNLIEAIRAECQRFALNFDQVIQRIQHRTVIVDFELEQPFNLVTGTNIEAFRDLIWTKLAQTDPEFVDQCTQQSSRARKVLSPTSNKADAWDYGDLSLYRYQDVSSSG